MSDIISLHERVKALEEAMDELYRAFGYEQEQGQKQETNQGKIDEQQNREQGFDKKVRD